MAVSSWRSHVIAGIVTCLFVASMLGEAFVVRPGELDPHKRNDEQKYRLNAMQQRAWAAKTDPTYFIGKRSSPRNACWSDLDCSPNECCALSVTSALQHSPLLGPTNHVEAPVCKPLGQGGEVCFDGDPGAFELGCGCQDGLRCVTFSGFNFGVCG